MTHLLTLVRRELGAYFLGPMAYLVLLGFQVVAAFNFYELIGMISRPGNEFSSRFDPMNGYLAGSVPFWFTLMVAIPLLTMRLISEERRTGAIESLLTAPVTESEIVLSKWIAGVVMYLVLLLPFFLYLPVLRHYGRYAFDLGPVAALGIGLTTMGMMFVAIGLFFSALTRHQVVAAVGTFVTLFLLVIMAMLAAQHSAEVRSDWAAVWRFVSVVAQTYEFGSGQIDLRHLAMHLSVASFFLYVAVKVLDSRRG